MDELRLEENATGEIGDKGVIGSTAKRLDATSGM